MIVNNGKSVKFRREFRVPVEKLYKAWTDPEVFKSWWKDTAVAEMDVRVGGSYLIKWHRPADDYARGIYKEVNPHQKLVMTWETSDLCGGEKKSLVKDSLITILFKSLTATSSEMEFTHDFLPADRIDDHSLGWTAMFLDLDQHFNAQTRKVDPNLKTEVSKTFPYPIEKVYQAWSDPKLLNAWFNSAGHTAGTASAPMKVGTNMVLDFQKRNGDVLRIYGEYKEIIPLKKIVFTWVDDNHDHVSIHRQYESLVTVDFEDLRGKTKLTVTHSHLSSEEEMKNFELGWNDCLQSIEEELGKISEGAK